MGRYLFRRLIQVPIVLWILVTISFFLMRAAPGGPFDQEKPIDPVIKQRMMEKYHLDKHVMVQYYRFLEDLAPIHLRNKDGHFDPGLGFDLGPSFKNKAMTVNEVIRLKAPVSALLGLAAVLIALLLGLGAGIIAGVRQNSGWDYASMTVAMVGLALPTFVVGPLLALTFGLWWKVLPVAGYADEGGFLGGLKQPQYLILPAIALALPFAARIARLTRAGMLEVINQDYIRTAWAKGLPERIVVLRHALRGAMLPVVSFLGPAVAQILTGSLVVEQIFAIPGIGREFVTSATNRDYTMVMGTVILFGILLIFFNLIVDVVYGLIDPRIRYT